MSRKPSPADRLRVFLSRLSRWVGNLLDRPERQLTALALGIGIVTGLGAIGFSQLVHLVTKLCFEQIGRPWRQWELHLLLLPAGGALLVGLITWRFAPEAEGHGVPEVMDAMARRGGRIRPRVAVAKAITSALTIGSGGAAGTEGPIIQIGAAIGSGFGQWLRVSLDDIRVMIGCGAAAGIASIFNAPLAGVLFAVEVLLRDVSLRSFVPIIISAVLSSTVTQAIRGHNDPIFPIPVELRGYRAEPVYAFTIPEFGNYLALGLVCGVVGAAFIRLLYAAEDLFRRLPVHRILRPVAGAVLLGGLAIAAMRLTQGRTPLSFAVPAIMGNGYPVISAALEPRSYGDPGGWTADALLVLLICKAAGTCLTLGSGGSGGVFAPSLFLGATTGGAFGLLVQTLPWFAGADPGAYALVGMAAVVAATIHAPLTATLILFEMTRDYKVIIPIMTAAVAALAVARSIEPASIYTLKLLRRGVRLGSSAVRLLQRISVSELPRAAAPLVRADDSVDALLTQMRSGAAQDFVVVDERGRAVGMVLGDDLRTMLLESEAIPLLTVSDVMREDFVSLAPDETLDQALDKFAGRPYQALPLVDPLGQNGVIGMISRAAVMNRYHQAIRHSETE